MPGFEIIGGRLQTFLSFIKENNNYCFKTYEYTPLHISPLLLKQSEEDITIEKYLKSRLKYSFYTLGTPIYNVILHLIQNCKFLYKSLSTKTGVYSLKESRAHLKLVETLSAEIGTIPNSTPEQNKILELSKTLNNDIKWIVEKAAFFKKVDILISKLNEPYAIKRKNKKPIAWESSTDKTFWEKLRWEFGGLIYDVYLKDENLNDILNENIFTKYLTKIIDDEFIEKILFLKNILELTEKHNGKFLRYLYQKTNSYNALTDGFCGGEVLRWGFKLLGNSSLPELMPSPEFKSFKTALDMLNKEELPPDLEWLDYAYHGEKLDIPNVLFYHMHQHQILIRNVKSIEMSKDGDNITESALNYFASIKGPIAVVEILLLEAKAKASSDMIMTSHSIGLAEIRNPNTSQRVYVLVDTGFGEVMFSNYSNFKLFFKDFLNHNTLKYRKYFQNFSIHNLNEAFLQLEESNKTLAKDVFELTEQYYKEYIPKRPILFSKALDSRFRGNDERERGNDEKGRGNDGRERKNGEKEEVKEPLKLKASSTF